MKQTDFFEALEASRIRCEQDIAAAQERATKLYDSLVEKAVARHDKRVARIEKRVEKLARARSGINELTGAVSAVNDMRATIVSKISHLAFQTGHEQRALWTSAYSRLFQATGVNPKAHVKSKRDVALDIVERFNLLAPLMEVVNGMMEDPAIFAGAPATPARPS